MTETPHLNGLARQIAADANRRLAPQANPFSDRSYSEDVVGIDPVTISVVLALLQFIAKTCIERRMARVMRGSTSRANKATRMVVRACKNCDATKSLRHPIKQAIAEAVVDCVVNANDATVSLIAQEIGWAEVAGE